MILVRNRKRANVARQFLNEWFDWLMSRTPQDQTQFVSGRQMLGRPWERHILGGWAFVSRIWSEADRTQCDYKSTLRRVMSGGANEAVEVLFRSPHHPSYAEEPGHLTAHEKNIIGHRQVSAMRGKRVNALATVCYLNLFYWFNFWLGDCNHPKNYGDLLIPKKTE